MKRYYLAALATLLFFAGPELILAQNRGGASNGMFGNRQVGNGSLGSGSPNASGGNNPAGGLSSGMGIDTNMRQNQARFVGAGNNAGSGFVGNASAQGAMSGMGGVGGMSGLGGGMTGMSGLGGMGMGGRSMGMGGMGMSSMGLGGLGGMGMGGRGMGGMSAFGGLGGLGMGGRSQFGGMQNQTNRGGRAGQQQTQIRTTMRTAFQAPARDGSAVSNDLARRITRSSMMSPGAQMQVQISAGTAILRGTVASDHERQLAERVAMLEPGVTGVQNELVVAGDAQQ